MFDEALTAYGVARRVADALAAARIPFAVGGALAYNYWGASRGTVDADLNVFAGLDVFDRVVDALGAIGVDIDRELSRHRVAEGAHAVGHLGEIKVDLFFNSIPLHDEAARRTVVVDILGRPAPILSAEDTVLFKLLFFRGKDRVDVERLVGLQGRTLDRDYIRRWLVDMVGEDDQRVVKWDEICRELPPE